LEKRNFSDVTGDRSFKKIMQDKKILSDLGQLKGALSDRELAFIAGLNITEATPREAAILTIQLYKKANDIAALKAKITNDHLANLEIHKQKIRLVKPWIKNYLMLKRIILS
jgi:hypothetical protein